ncbi:ABC transporter ATP-binding protein [Geopsychrobacter electrodiphilus]|uniref:ABC transporter ATP-binding protein n=1 Tax=Geopsychrobacter electrodiphilus TaxID=225196 RepID=UPI000376019F|nr:ABC transporter ATP-binding protein [Geopsychrobacter electrodiphilus]
MLKVTNLRAGYGAINILWDLSLVVTEGKLTTILGPNGAGKTTLLRAIMGLLPITQGEIMLGEQSLLGIKTWDMAKHGIVMIPEGRMIFKEMSVEENLIIGAFPKDQRLKSKENLKRVYAMFPRLQERRTQLAGSLSGGEAQMVAIGRGLMAEPKTIIMDEPTLGLAPVIVKEIASIIKLLKNEGRTIVLVEQNTHMAVSLSDHVYLMQTGKILMSEKAENVDLDKLHDLYFGK